MRVQGTKSIISMVLAAAMVFTSAGFTAPNVSYAAKPVKSKAVATSSAYTKAKYRNAASKACRTLRGYKKFSASRDTLAKRIAVADRAVLRAKRVGVSTKSIRDYRSFVNAKKVYRVAAEKAMEAITDYNPSVDALGNLNGYIPSAELERRINRANNQIRLAKLAKVNVRMIEDNAKLEKLSAQIVSQKADELVASNIILAINNLPTVSNVQISDKSRVDSAVNSYNNASAFQKALVGRDKFNSLKAVETALQTKLNMFRSETVTVLNASQLQIKFNKSVSDYYAKNIANYEFKRNNLVQNVSGSIAQIDVDNNVVTLTFNKSIASAVGFGTVYTPTAFTFRVKDVRSTAGEMVFSQEYSVTINDKTLPTIRSVNADTSNPTNRLFIYLSEPVQRTGLSVSVDNITVRSSQLNTKGDIITVETTTAMEPGKNYTVRLYGAKDLAGNSMVTNPAAANVLIPGSYVTPAVSAVNVLGENKLQVIFSKAMNQDTVKAGIRLQNNLGGALNGDFDISPTDSRTFTVIIKNAGTVCFPASKTAFQGRLYFANTIKDSFGTNMTATYRNITLNKDVTAPSISSIEYKEKNVAYSNIANANGLIVLNFSENISTNDLNQHISIIIGVIDNNSSEDYIGRASTDIFVVEGNKVVLRLKKALDNGTYSLNIPAGLVKDSSISFNTNPADSSKNFAVRNNIPADSEKPVVGNVTHAKVSANPDTWKISIEVTDNVAIDLNTVSNVNNYKIGSENVVTDQKNISFSSSDGNKLVTITLTVNANPSGNTITITGIKDTSGNAI